MSYVEEFVRDALVRHLAARRSPCSVRRSSPFSAFAILTVFWSILL